LLNSPLVQELIGKGDVAGIKPIMAKSRELGMQTFDQHLFELQQTDIISYDEAIGNADSPNELRLRIKLEGKDSGNKSEENIFKFVERPKEEASHH